VRAGAGAHFRMPIECGVPWDLVQTRMPKYAQVVLADLHREDKDSEQGKAKDIAFWQKVISCFYLVG
jgi:hypothetical protein